VSEYVRFEITDEVATVTLDRPEVRNALTSDVAASVESDTPVRKRVERVVGSAAGRSLDETIDAETATQALSASTADHVEGVQAFVEHREPEFEGE